MTENHLWNLAKNVRIQTSPEIVGNFDIGFDSRIPEETKDMLMDFVYWVEDHFNLQVTLWVDFKYRHYLRDQNGKPVGYRFYWVDFTSYPVFEIPDDIPVIELAVRTEHQTMEDILLAFITAISRYFAWLTNTQAENVDAEVVLHAYLNEI